MYFNRLSGFYSFGRVVLGFFNTVRFFSNEIFCLKMIFPTILRLLMFSVEEKTFSSPKGAFPNFGKYEDSIKKHSEHFNEIELFEPEADLRRSRLVFCYITYGGKPITVRIAHY